MMDYTFWLNTPGIFFSMGYTISLLSLILNVQRKVVLQILSPALVSYALINFVSQQASGLGYIFFSNADVSKEVRTAANLSSAYSAITCMVILGIAILIGMTAAFFRLNKKA